MRCPQCDEANSPMGSLARTNHYRCRACGWVYSWSRERAPAKLSPDQGSLDERLDDIDGSADWDEE